MIVFEHQLTCDVCGATGTIPAVPWSRLTVLRLPGWKHSVHRVKGRRSTRYDLCPDCSEGWKW